MELLDKLGVDWKILIAQIVNFAILLAILYRFLYKPVLGMMQERSKKIEKGVKQAEEMERKAQEMEEAYKAEIEKGRREAGGIIGEATKKGEEVKDGMVKEAQEKIEKSLEKAKGTIRDEKEKMISEIKGEVSEMVVLATEKVIKEKLDSGTDKKLIEETVSQIKK